ncbi:MAG: cyclohexanecarboxylate-CoA ligase [Alphaproteobacteria bacterium]|nr:cyclohexanecarboxylate-CoA ligase [Alphaproteobacteria bacterium]
MRLDASGWTTRLTDELIAENTASGIWRNRTLADELAGLVATTPKRVLYIEGDTRYTVEDMDRQARALATGLQARGLIAGDVVSFELPNWPEAVVIDLACTMLGLVCNPIIPIYRDAEVSYILRDAGTKAVFVPTKFRKFDYADMIARHRAELPELEHVITVRGQAEGATTFEGLMAEGTAQEFVAPDVDPNAVKLIMYTSGTTGHPKGVLHSHNTIDTEIQAISGFLGLSDRDVILMPSPVSHITGYLYGIQMPFTLNAPAVFMETWDAEVAGDLIDEFSVTFTIAATVFLQELTLFSQAKNRSLPSLRYFPSGGAPVPPEVIHNAHQAFENCVCSRVYGSTEAPTVTLGVNNRSEEVLGATTEGHIVGHEVRIVDPANGRDAEPGVEGEILSRGPEMCLGYAAAEHNADAFEEDGFFHTGDLAILDASGALVITGRSKDLIIRGGENISPREVEDVLHEHPAIHEVAVVAMPHPRMGETGCAFVVLKSGANLDLNGIVAFLAETGMAKQKYPERLEVIDAFPRTAAGKIRKNVLRERVAGELQTK